MSAVQVVEAGEPATDPLVARLDGLLAELGAAVADGKPTCDAARIDRIARLEQLRAVTAALQAAECVRFAQSQVAEQMAAHVHPEAIGRGIADQIALACKLSPFTGSRRLAVARALWFDLPDTYAQLTAGRLSERVAEIVVSETRHLDARLRRDVDTQLVAAGISEMGLRSAAACARKHAYETDPEGYTDRGRTERKHRRVSIRPAPDTMAMLSGYLPVEQGVACYAALKKHTDTLIATGDERSRDQIMADTLVEWLTGQAHATDVNLEVQIMMPIDSLTAQPPHRHHPRCRTTPRTAGTADHHQQSRPEMVAATVHRTRPGRPRPDRRRRPIPPPLRRLARQTHHPPRPNLHRPVLRRRHPTPRPHPPTPRPRPNHTHQRPRQLCPRQLHPRNAGLATRPHPLRTRRPTARHLRHHTHRAHLPQPRTRPALIRAIRKTEAD
jgi:hypothetical protein